MYHQGTTTPLSYCQFLDAEFEEVFAQILKADVKDYKIGSIVT